MNWINIKDEQPSVKQDVLVFHEDNDVFMATWWPPNFYLFYSDTGGQRASDQNKIKKWMPLPAPPED